MDTDDGFIDMVEFVDAIEPPKKAYLEDEELKQLNLFCDWLDGLFSKWHDVFWPLIRIGADYHCRTLVVR